MSYPVSGSWPTQKNQLSLGQLKVTAVQVKDNYNKIDVLIKFERK